MYTSTIRIAESPTYTLDSHGNGAAYTFRAKADDGSDSTASVFLQGEDATRFRAELDAIETAHPEWSREQMLGCLWLDHDYDLAASED